VIVRLNHNCQNVSMCQRIYITNSVVERDCSSFIGENGFIHSNQSVIKVKNVLWCSLDDKIYSINQICMDM